MIDAKLRSVAAATMVLTTWTFAATAQEPPTTDPPTAPEVTPSTTPSAPTDPPAPITLAQATPESTTMVVQPPMNTYDTTTYPNRPLLLTGFVVLGASYGASAIAAGISDRESNDKLYYPVAGPWLALEDRDCNADPCNNKTLHTSLLIGSGVLQGLGALSMVMSLFVPEKTTQSWSLIGNSDFAVTPVAGTSEVGATAIGRF